MVDAVIVYEWFIENNASPHKVAEKFEVTVEQAYELLREGEKQSNYKFERAVAPEYGVAL